MKRIIISVCLLLIVVADASALSLLVSRGNYLGNQFTFGLGTADWWEANLYLSQNTALAPSYALNLENNAQVMSADALWINERWTSGTLSGVEMNNLTQFIATGRKVVFIGENNLWRTWNNQFLSLFGATTDPTSHFWSGHQDPLIQNSLTAGMTGLFISEGGVPFGGKHLFAEGVVSLFGPNDNVLAVLDSNVYAGNLSPFEGHKEFAVNTFKWLSAVPEPSAMTLIMCGSILLAYTTQRVRMKK